MGVLGLTPFLQKNCPEVIRKLPERLRSLKGRTVVIDGTLITQRFHFAASPLDKRHVLGWYRLLLELKESDIRTICLFDGQKRNQAKALEAARRREVRKLSEARGSIELDRSKRLDKMKNLVKEYQLLRNTERERVKSTLKESFAKAKASSPLLVKKTISNLKAKTKASTQPKATVDCEESQRISDPHSTSKGASLPKAEAESGAESSTRPTKAIKDSLTHNLPESYPTTPASSIHEIESQIQFYPISESTDGNERQMSNIYIKPPRTAGSQLMELVRSSQPPSLQPKVVIDHQIVFADLNLHHLDQSHLQEEELRELLLARIGQGAITALCKLDTWAEQSTSDLSEDPDVTFDEFYGTDSHGVFVRGFISEWEGDPWMPSPILVRSDIQPEQFFSIALPLPPIDMSVALVSLYQEYCQSISKITSLPSPQHAPLVSSQEPCTDQTEYAMSKQQLQLTIDEGKIWDGLVRPTTVPPLNALPEEIEGTDTTLASLAEKSNAMSQSFERRNNPPTSDTYEECKEIIRAMGVPCLNTSGAYEAEALAASIVVHGHADYVVSEDTDVLVYEAPLIRNVTNRLEPLILVSGSEVRTILEMDRTAFVDFALLLGTDFSSRIKGLGPQRALKLIKEHGSIERIIENERKYVPRVSEENYMDQVKMARAVFETLPPIPELKLLKMKDANENMVSRILQRHNLYRAALRGWNHTTALDGNYFKDNPEVTI